MLIRRAKPHAGFTLIEMITVMGIFAVLVALGVPIMRTWIANVQVRSVADAIQNGVRLAQTEALRRSRQVVFSLTNSTTPQTSLTAAVNGTYWAVTFIPAMTDGTETNLFIQSGVASGTSPTVSVTGPAEICFNSVGRLVANGSTSVAGGTCTLPATTPPVWTYTVTASNADHPLAVEVALGGQIHLCDTHQTLSSTNTYGC